MMDVRRRRKYIQPKQFIDIILHHWNWAKMVLTQHNKWWRRNKEAGTFLLTRWNGPLVEPFWKEVLKTLSSRSNNRFQNPHSYGC